MENIFNDALGSKSNISLQELKKNKNENNKYT